MACAIWEEKKRSLQDLGSDSGKSPRFRRLLQFPHLRKWDSRSHAEGSFSIPGFNDDGRKAGRPSWNIGHKTIISHFASFRDLFKVRSVICYNAYRLRRLGKLPKLSFLVFLTLKDISGKDCQFAAVVIVCFLKL